MHEMALLQVDDRGLAAGTREFHPHGLQPVRQGLHQIREREGPERRGDLPRHALGRFALAGPDAQRAVDPGDAQVEIVGRREDIVRPGIEQRQRRHGIVVRHDHVEERHRVEAVDTAEVLAFGLERVVVEQDRGGRAAGDHGLGIGGVGGLDRLVPDPAQAVHEGPDRRRRVSDDEDLAIPVAARPATVLVDLTNVGFDEFEPGKAAGLRAQSRLDARKHLVGGGVGDVEIHVAMPAQREDLCGEFELAERMIGVIPVPAAAEAGCAPLEHGVDPPRELETARGIDRRREVGEGVARQQEVQRDGEAVGGQLPQSAAAGEQRDVSRNETIGHGDAELLATELGVHLDGLIHAANGPAVGRRILQQRCAHRRIHGDVRTKAGAIDLLHPEHERLGHVLGHQHVLEAVGPHSLFELLAILDHVKAPPFADEHRGQEVLHCSPRTHHEHALQVRVRLRSGRDRRERTGGSSIEQLRKLDRPSCLPVELCSQLQDHGFGSDHRVGRRRAQKRARPFDRLRVRGVGNGNGESSPAGIALNRQHRMLRHESRREFEEHRLVDGILGRHDRRNAELFTQRHHELLRSQGAGLDQVRAQPPAALALTLERALELFLVDEAQPQENLVETCSLHGDRASQRVKAGRGLEPDSAKLRMESGSVATRAASSPLMTPSVIRRWRS